MPAQDVTRRGAARELPPRMAFVQQREELLAAPPRVSPPRLQDRAHDLLSRLIGRAPRPARALLQARRPLAQVAVDPLVPCLARDTVQGAEFGHRLHVAQVIGDELRPLVHG